MGIAADLVEALIREHLYRPISGDVVMIRALIGPFCAEPNLGLFARVWH
jgi:hypothetical protein